MCLLMENAEALHELFAKYGINFKGYALSFLTLFYWLINEIVVQFFLRGLEAAAFHELFVKHEINFCVNVVLFP